MIFHEIVSPQDAYFRFADALYVSSFPVDERRESLMWFELMKENAGFHVIVALWSDDNKKQEPVGLMCYWEFSAFLYVEHLAITTSCRRQHYGTTLIEHVGLKGKPIVLEVEPDSDEWTHNRLLFYQSMGFVQPYYNYLQPPYGGGKQSVALWLLSNCPEWLHVHVDDVKQTLYIKVYQIESIEKEK